MQVTISTEDYPTKAEFDAAVEWLFDDFTERFGEHGFDTCTGIKGDRETICFTSHRDVVDRVVQRN